MQTILANFPQLKEMAIAIQDFYYHPHTSTNTGRDLNFTLTGVSKANETPKNNLSAADSIYIISPGIPGLAH